MIKKKLCKLITTGLIITMFIGSVGTTVSAAEADTASTDIIMLTEDGESSREESPAINTAQESLVPATDLETGPSADDSSGNAVNTDPSANEEVKGELLEEQGESTAPEDTELQTEITVPEGEKTQMEEETAENEVVTEPVAAGNTLVPEEGAQDPPPEDETDSTFTVTGLELSRTELELDEKTTVSITANIAVETTDIENIADQVAKVITCVSSDDTIAVIKAGSAVVVSSEDTGEPDAGQDGCEADLADVGEPAGPIPCIVELTMKVSARKEGTAVLYVSADGTSAECSVCVNPVPVALGKSGNLQWKSVTVLYWNAVKNASSYKLILYLNNNGKTYTLTKTVKGTHCDLEDDIISLIRKNKASLAGASYKIRAAIRAIPSDTRHYKMGPGTVSYSFRYLYSTYQEAVSRNGWFYKVGKWYLYDSGVKQTGWVTFLNKRYYLDTDGSLKTSCWIGKYYVKSNGELARDEWVDNYQYYVDAKGVRQDSVTFKTANWIKNAKGWRYKTPLGYIKGKWKNINHRWYYFDQTGYMKTGWHKEGTVMYYLKPSGDITEGRGAMQTGWVKRGGYYYWFGDDGKLVTNSWVDRNQYYVGNSGKRISHLSYMNLRNTNTSNRLGYYVYNSGAAPEQSIAGFEKSYQQGNRIMVINLRFTTDNIPVCFHDDQIKYARRKDGAVPGRKPVISSSTLKQLQEYDYGIKWGKQYKGTGPLTLEDMIKWISKHSDTEVYIEVKVNNMNAAQIKKTASILNKYKVVDRTSMIFDTKTASDTRAQRVHKQMPTLRIGITTGSVGALAIEKANKCKSSKNEVFLYCWKTTKLSAAIINKLKALDVQFECGTFDKQNDLNEILNYYSKGASYAYNSGVETAGDVFHKLLRTATYHEKAHWVAENVGKKYMMIDGTFARNRWLTLNGQTYRFDQNGILMTNSWLTLNGKKYYLNSRGERVTGKRVVGGHRYLFDEDGVCRKKLT